MRMTGYEELYEAGWKLLFLHGYRTGLPAGTIVETWHPSWTCKRVSSAAEVEAVPFAGAIFIRLTGIGREQIG